MRLAPRTRASRSGAASCLAVASRPAVASRLAIALPLLLGGCAAPAETPFAPPRLPGTPGDPATSITADEIQAHVDVLASDLLQGREAGTRGEQLASKYIIAQLQECPRLQPAGVDGGWLQPFPIRLHEQDTVAHNILAVLPGSDPELAHEVIVLGAHYDHVGLGESGNTLDGKEGRGQVHNGADDNASGSATLLDLALSLCHSGWQPRRTLLFQWYSGEELGLLGSRFYAEHPLLPLEDTVFMLNMDMVGRLFGDTLVVGGTGTSPGLAETCRALCGPLALNMVDDPPGSAPSDNTSFYDHHIPVLFLFTGLHEDYHAATDDSWKLNAEGAARVGQLAEEVLLTLDARDARPEFRIAPGQALMFRPHPYIGATFGPPPDETLAAGVVTVVLADSPAEHGGLHAGDLVLAIDGERPTDLADLERRAEHLDASVPPLRFRVLRGGPAGETIEITVQPTVR